MSKQVDYSNIPEDFLSLSGLEQMEKVVSDDRFRPSISVTLDFELTKVEAGKAMFTGHPSDKHMNPIGSVHGGYAATLLDSALGCSIHTTLEPGERYTTVDLNIKYIRAIQPGIGAVFSTGEVVHKGRRIATADATLVDKNGKLLAHGSTTCIIL